MQLVPAAAGALSSQHLDTAGYVKEFYDANVSLAGQQTMFIDKFIATVLADKKLTEEAKSRIIALAMNDRLLYQNKPKTNTTSTTVVIPCAPVPVPVTPPGSPKPKPRKPRTPTTPKIPKPEIKSEDEDYTDEEETPKGAKPKQPRGDSKIPLARRRLRDTIYGKKKKKKQRELDDDDDEDSDDIPAAAGGHVPERPAWSSSTRIGTRSMTRGGYSLPSEDEDSTDDDDSDDNASIFGGALESTIRAAWE